MAKPRPNQALDFVIKLHIKYEKKKKIDVLELLKFYLVNVFVFFIFFPKKNKNTKQNLSVVNYFCIIITC